jgi:hypothetical protein
LTRRWPYKRNSNCVTTLVTWHMSFNVASFWY